MPETPELPLTEEPSLTEPVEGLPVEGLPVEGLPVEAALGAAEGAMPPVEGGVPPEAGLPDLEALLSELDAMSAPAEAPQQDLNAMLQQARQDLRSSEPDEDADLLVNRIGKLEGAIQQMSSRNEELRRDSIKRDISQTINDTVSSEISRLGLDPSGSATKAYSRIVSDGTLVAVAKAQAMTGKIEVDADSIRQTVKKFSKLVERVAGELVAHEAAKKRRAPGGAAPSLKPTTAVKDMDQEQFDAAVLSALRGTA